ncbi:unnamed protein product [Parajaminaea phylloscopi]
MYASSELSEALQPTTPTSSSQRQSSSSSSSRSRRRSPKLLAAVGCALAAASSCAAQSSISINPPANQNGAAPLSAIINPAYAGMGIEPTSLYAYTGTSQRNMLTYNLLNNLRNYTGVPPHIRVGGNAGDTMLYNASTSGFTIQQNPNPTGSGYNNPSDLLYFGPDYFRAMDNFPADTPITYGLNLAYQGSGWLDAIVAQANASLNGVQGVNIVGFEIGNEPDLYTQNGFRTQAGWTASNFGTEWKTAAVAIYNRVLKAKGIGSNFFEPPATATTATDRGKPFEIQYLVNTDVATDNGIYVAGWNQHDYYYYIDVSDYTLTPSLVLDLSTTTSQFKAWREQSQQAYNTGKPYYLREMGSVGPTGIQGISDTFANTLWTLNFFLYAATVQVASVQIHMTSESFASPWLPVTSSSTGESPRVRSSYYAFAAFDQIVGATCNVRVASYSLSNVPSGYTNRLASYHAYADGKLQTLVAFNTQPSASSNSQKGSVTFRYSVPAWAGQTVYLSTLSAPGSDATANTTWNGLSYEQTGNGMPSTVDSSSHTVTVGSDGSLSFSVRDSQVVAANLGSKLGTANAVVNSANCAALGGSTSEGNDANPTNTSLAGSGGSAAPTFSSAPPANNPFYSGAPPSMAVVPSLAALAVGSLALGFLFVTL